MKPSPAPHINDRYRQITRFSELPCALQASISGFVTELQAVIADTDFGAPTCEPILPAPKMTVTFSQENAHEIAIQHKKHRTLHSLKDL